MPLLHDFKHQVIDGFKETFIPKRVASVEKIHKEFNTAGDKTLAKAKHIIATINKEKGERLKTLGFAQAKETDSVQVVEKAEETHQLILDYSIKYPGYRFIATESIKTICKKYSLIYGPINRFKGFVPLEKLEAIERFKKNCKINKMIEFSVSINLEPSEILFLDDFVEEQSSDYKVLYYIKNDAKVVTLDGDSSKIHSFQQSDRDYDGIHYYGTSPISGRHGKARIVGLQICAPEKDMDTTGMKLDGHILKMIPKDPVVIQPMPGGGLIIAAWGDEASDPLVVNEKLN